MDSRDKQVEEIFDSLHHLPKVATPKNLFFKIESNISKKAHSKTSQYWQYAAAILIALNTLTYLFLKPTEDNSQEVTSQYDEYIENYNWSQNNYYEYLTVSE